MRKLNWPIIFIGAICVCVGFIWLHKRVTQVEHRPHITVWTYLTPEDIALLRADGARPVILKGVAHLDEIDVFAEDSTVAEEE